MGYMSELAMDGPNEDFGVVTTAIDEMESARPIITADQQLRNVAAVVVAQTEVTRHYNGRGRPATYAANIDAIAGSARQLAEMITAYLDGTLADRVDDGLPF